MIICSVCFDLGETRELFFIPTEWSGKVGEFVLIQVKHFKIFYVLYQCLYRNMCTLNTIFLRFPSPRTAWHFSFPYIQLGIVLFIDREALAKQGDNALGSVRPSVRPCVCFSALSRLMS